MANYLLTAPPFLMPSHLAGSNNRHPWNNWRTCRRHPLDLGSTYLDSTSRILRQQSGEYGLLLGTTSRLFWITYCVYCKPSQRDFDQVRVERVCGLGVDVLGCHLDGSRSDVLRSYKDAVVGGQPLETRLGFREYHGKGRFICAA